MPLYEYYCPHCHTIFEQIRSFSDADEPIPCINCFNIKVKRNLSRIAVSKTDTQAGGNASGCCGCTSHNCSNCH